MPPTKKISTVHPAAPVGTCDYYTPGPWMIDANNKLAIGADKGNKIGPTIAVVIDRKCDAWPSSQGELTANARLIAAAPDLLDACRAFVEAHEKTMQLEKTDVAYYKAIAALEKAIAV